MCNEFSILLDWHIWLLTRSTKTLCCELRHVGPPMTVSTICTSLGAFPAGRTQWLLPAAIATSSNHMPKIGQAGCTEVEQWIDFSTTSLFIHGSKISASPCWPGRHSIHLWLALLPWRPCLQPTCTTSDRHPNAHTAPLSSTSPSHPLVYRADTPFTSPIPTSSRHAATDQGDKITGKDTAMKWTTGCFIYLMFS